MPGDRSTRRRLLVAGSATIVGILAGCSDPGDDDEDDGEDDGGGY